MSKRLAATVVLTSADGGTVTLKAGSTPPADLAEKITNPDAWMPEDFEPTPAAPVPPEQVAPVTVRPDPPAHPSSELGTAGPDVGAEPARNGTTEAWAKYAEGLGQDVAADAKRDAIIAQLVAAGLIKE